MLLLLLLLIAHSGWIRRQSTRMMSSKRVEIVLLLLLLLLERRKEGRTIVDGGVKESGVRERRRVRGVLTVVVKAVVFVGRHHGRKVSGAEGARKGWEGETRVKELRVGVGKRGRERVRARGTKASA